MKTLHTAGLLLLLFGLTASAYTQPAPPPRATPTLQSPPASSGQLGQLLLLRYRYLQGTELPQLLAWLRDWGPFTQPPPGLLPGEAAAPALTDR